MNLPGFNLASADTGLACAYCGRPLHTLHSFGLTTPIGDKVEPGDFCSLTCLASWAIAQIPRNSAEYREC